MTRGSRRNWAPNTLGIHEGYEGVCRVCSTPIKAGEPVYRFQWSEERGQAHCACGFWSPMQDNYLDREAVEVARLVLAAPTYLTKPYAMSKAEVFVDKHITDRAVKAALARRADGKVVPTAIGQALFNRLKKERQAS